MPSESSFAGHLGEYVGRTIGVLNTRGCKKSLPMEYIGFQGSGLASSQLVMGKRRQDKVEFYNDMVPATRAVLASPAPIQHIQRHTEISSRDTSTVKINQIYYSITGPPLQQCPSRVVEEVQWSTQPIPDGIESVFDEPINFVNPPTAADELEIMDDNPQANRYLGVMCFLLHTIPLT